MVSLYSKDHLKNIQKQKNKCLILYCLLLAVAVVFVGGIIYYYSLQPFASTLETPLKIIMFAFSILFIVFSCVYLEIVFGRVNRYYKHVKNMAIGKKSTFTATVLSINYEQRSQDGVDFYSMDVLTWSDGHDDYIKRSILIDKEIKNLDVKEGEIITIVTSLNTLMGYQRGAL